MRARRRRDGVGEHAVERAQHVALVAVDVEVHPRRMNAVVEELFAHELDAGKLAR